MSNTMCDTSLFMLNNMTEMYEGLLSGEQTDVTSAEDLPDVTPTLKESERLMSNKLCTDTSMCMLMDVAKTYAGLLYGEQTDVTSADNLVCYHSTLKESEWEVNLLELTQAAGDGITNIMPNFFGMRYGTSTITTIHHC